MSPHKNTATLHWDGLQYRVTAISWAINHGRPVHMKMEGRLEGPIVTNTPRAGESAEQTSSRTREARDLYEFAKSGGPPEPVTRSLPRMHVQSPWTPDRLPPLPESVYGTDANDLPGDDAPGIPFPHRTALRAMRNGLHAMRIARIEARAPERPKDIAAFVLSVHQANAHWWHDPKTGKRLNRDLGEMLMLVISEISEAMEGERKDLMDDHLPHRKMAEVELADAAIRIADIVGSYGNHYAAYFERRLAGLKNSNYKTGLDNKAAELHAICAPLCAVDPRSQSRSQSHFVMVKLARAFHRIELYADAHGYDLWGAVASKRAYNSIRADHKPEARLAPGGKKW